MDRINKQIIQPASYNKKVQRTDGRTDGRDVWWWCTLQLREGRKGGRWGHPVCCLLYPSCTYYVQHQPLTLRPSTWWKKQNENGNAGCFVAAPFSWPRRRNPCTCRSAGSGCNCRSSSSWRCVPASSKRYHKRNIHCPQPSRLFGFANICTILFIDQQSFCQTPRKMICLTFIR